MADRLALAGGKPVRNDYLPYTQHRITAEDRVAVAKALDSAWLTTGPVVEQFEAELASFLGVPQAVAVSSGTAALHLAALAAGVRPGTSLVTSSLTFVASANAALFCGARPVLTDIDENSLNMDPSDLASRVDGSTRVIVPVHFAGQPCRMTEIEGVARKTGAFIVEDAAHAFGARIGDRSAGCVGDAGVFSFHPAKHVTTFEGGAIVSADEAFIEETRRLRNHGIDAGVRDRLAGATWEYDVSTLGYNYRLSDVACALGLSQLSRIPEKLAGLRELASLYRDRLRGLERVTIPAVAEPGEHAWHLFPILLDPSIDRAWAFAALRAENIGVNVHYIPIYAFSMYEKLGFTAADYPRCSATYPRLLSLPLFFGMTPRDVDDVVAALEKVLAVRDDL